jgi:ABC-type transport system substrate-binding protein
MIIVALIASGCAQPTQQVVEKPSEPTATQVVVQEPTTPPSIKSDKTILVAYAASATGLDPHEARLVSDWGIALHIFERLWEFPVEGGDPFPVLAESWEFNSDKTALTIKLRQGIKFHDGTPWNAAAAKFNLDRLSSKEKPVRNRGGLDNAIASTDVVDEYTIIVNMAQPFPPFFRLLGRAPSGMISPTAYEKYGEDFGANPVGTGPFIFKEWIQGQSLEMVRNDAWWGGEVPAAGIKYIFVPEASTRIVMVETGDAHFADVIPYSEVDMLKQAKGLQIKGNLSEFSYYIAMNEKTTEGATPFADKNVRLAVNYAVDKEGIINSILRGFGTPSVSSVGPQTPQHCEAGYYPYDPEKAKTLLAEAGYPNGFKTSLVTVFGRYPMDGAVAEAVQGYLAEVGITLEIITLDTGAYSEQILADFGKGPVANPELIFRGFSSGGALDGGILMTQQTTANWPPNGFNVAYYSNPDFDNLVKQANSTWDENARKDLLCQAQKIFFNDAHWIFLYYLDQVTIYSDILVGAVVTPGDLIDFRKAYVESK